MKHLGRWGIWIAGAAVGLALVVGLVFVTCRVRAAVAGTGCNMTGAAAASCPMATGQRAAPQTAPGGSSGSGFSCH